MQSSHDLVRGQSPKALGVGSPVGGRVGGYTPIVVKIYALGRGVTLVGQGGDLLFREGAFELEAHGKVFVFDPLGAIQAHGLVAPVEGNVAPVRLALQAVDQKDLPELGNGVGHGVSSVKTTILALPQGYGKTSIGQQLADKLGCTRVVEEWYAYLPLIAGALHLTNEAVEVAA